MEYRIHLKLNITLLNIRINLVSNLLNIIYHFILVDACRKTLIQQEI
jgi:hypothetical protein